MRLHPGCLAAAIFIAAAGIVFGSPRAGAANLAEACGGPDRITCNSALWCRKTAGQCGAADAAGACEKAPDFCIPISRPVCGCNGKTYPSECELRKAKAQLDHPGRCKK